MQNGIHVTGIQHKQSYIRGTDACVADMTHTTVTVAVLQEYAATTQHRLLQLTAQYITH